MIKAVDDSNLSQLLCLMREYQTFYDVPNICEQTNSDFFAQFGEGSPQGCQFLYLLNGQAVAFATVYFSFSSTIAAKVGVLNDVYVHPNARRKGIANALIEHCRAYTKQHGGQRLQWVTAPTNEAAQALYDKMNTKKSTWHLYTYPVDV